MTNFLLGTSLALSLALSACGDDPKPVSEREIFGDYSLSYDDVAKSTSVSAVLRERDAHGSTVTLATGSALLLNDQMLPLRNVETPTGTAHLYEKSIPNSDSDTSYKMSWTRGDGTHCDVVLSRPRSIHLSDATGLISSFKRGAAFNVDFGGDALADDETAVYSFAGGSENAWSNLVSTIQEPGRLGAVFTADETADLPTSGPLKLRVARVKVTLQQANCASNPGERITESFVSQAYFF